MRKVIIYIVAALLIPVAASAQKVAQKANILYLATGTPNIGIEIAAGRKLTFELNGAYNPWELSGESSMRHWGMHAGIRYWFCKSFESHFISADASYTRFDIGYLSIASLSDAAYKGRLVGGGISYGYHWPVAKRCGMEFTVGFGYMDILYEKYTCSGCTESLGSFRQGYLGPVRLGLSFVFFLR